MEAKGTDAQLNERLGAGPIDQFETLTYETTGRIARITLNRPERGNGITLEMPNEIAACVERANLDPDVSVIALAGNGKGFCGGYDLVLAAEQGFSVESDSTIAGRLATGSARATRQP